MLKASLIYLLSGLLGKAVPFLLLPILTVYLSPAEFGIVVIVQLAIQFSQALGGLCLNVNVPRKYFSQNREKNAKLIFNIYIVLFSSAFILFGIISFIALKFDELFGIPERWLLAMPILAFMGMSNLINLTLIRTREKPLVFMGFEVSQSVLNLLLTIYLVVFAGMGWEGRVIAIVISILVFGFLGIASLVKQNYLSPSLNIKTIQDVLSVSIPLIPHAVGVVVISISDRLFIEEMVGLEEVGIYSVAYYFGMVVMLFSDAFVKAWSPWFFKRMEMDGEVERKIIVKYTYIYIGVLLIGASIYSYLATLIFPLVVSAEYASASVYIPWICLGYVSFGVYQIFFPYLVYCGKTQFVTFATITAASINLIGNYFLIGFYGVMGAAYSTIIAFTLSAFIVVWHSVRLVKMPWRVYAG